MGYYPFGSKFFSDLTHYVRSGDFIVNEIAEAQSLNEFAFALGSLAHYASDDAGHRIAVNPSVGAEYPKLRNEYGEVVTYEENPTAHLRVEFGFDVLQVSRGNYASQAYHDFMVSRFPRSFWNEPFAIPTGWNCAKNLPISIWLWELTGAPSAPSFRK